MPTSVDDRTSYWDRYAEGVTDETPEEALKNAFGWTQYPGHGPGGELLGDPLTALELGSGRGDAVAALATKGITATGVDISETQCRHARERWGHLPSAQFEQGGVIDYLADTDERWDAIYSILGRRLVHRSRCLAPSHLRPPEPGRQADLLPCPCGSWVLWRPRHLRGRLRRSASVALPLGL